jgi:hypothetical protein
MNMTSGKTASGDNGMGLSLLSSNNSFGMGYPALSVYDANGTGAAVVLTNGTTSPAPSSTGLIYWGDANSRPAVTNSHGAVMRLASSYGQSAVGSTNATTSLNAITPTYAVATGDLGTNSVLRFTAGGHGTQGSTVQNLNWQIPVWSTTLGGSTDNGGLAASQGFHWHITALIYIGGSGTSAPVVMTGEFVWSAAIANATGRVVVMDTQRTAIDVTQVFNISFQAGWASITGAPTITCTSSLLERLGG